MLISQTNLAPQLIQNLEPSVMGHYFESNRLKGSREFENQKRPALLVALQVSAPVLPRIQTQAQVRQQVQ